MAKYKVEINREGCISCGACEAACPKNFKLDSESKGIVLNEIIDEKGLACNKEAEEVCPVDVIKISKL